MWLFCLLETLTQDKFDIVQFMPTQIKFLVTPLEVSTTSQSVSQCWVGSW